MPDVFDRLGVPRAINAAGTLTRLSGSLLCDEALQAMNEAARSFVRIDQLQAAAGKRIAEATGTEAGLVTSGAAAGLTLSAAACIAGDDFGRLDRLPDASGMPHEIVIARSHRNGYDHALRAAGARLVEVGLAERTRDPQRWEIEQAITAQTAAVAFCAGFSALDLEMVIEVAHSRGLPVIVDAAAALPPRAHLTAFSKADLIVFSGGKGLRGPQASGILCGRRDLVASAALAMLDLDYLPQLWNPPEELIPRQIVKRGVPNQGIGRGMKVGKEEIAGLVAALDRFVQLDEQAEIARLAGYVERLAAGWRGLKNVDIHVRWRAGLWPKLEVRVDLLSAGKSAIDLVRQLEEGTPPVHVDQGMADRGIIGIDPFGLRPADLEEIERRLIALLG